MFNNIYDRLSAYIQQLISDYKISDYNIQQLIDDYNYYENMIKPDYNLSNYELINKYNLLFNIILLNDYKICKLLLKSDKINLNIINPNIHSFCHNILTQTLYTTNNLKLIKIIINRTKYIYNNTLNIYMYINNDINIIKYLIKKGANIHYQDNSKRRRNCLTIAIDNNYDNLLQIIKIFKKTDFNFQRIIRPLLFNYRKYPYYYIIIKYLLKHKIYKYGSIYKLNIPYMPIQIFNNNNKYILNYI